MLPGRIQFHVFQMIALMCYSVHGRPERDSAKSVHVALWRKDGECSPFLRNSVM